MAVTPPTVQNLLFKVWLVSLQGCGLPEQQQERVLLGQRQEHVLRRGQQQERVLREQQMACVPLARVQPLV